MGNGWLDDVSPPVRRWALVVPLVIGTFCLCALETWQRGSFDPVGVPYQAALMTALVFVPGVILLRLVHTKLCWGITILVLAAAPMIGLVRSVEAGGTRSDAFLPLLVTVLVLGVGAAIIVTATEIVLRPDDHRLARRLAHHVVGASRPAGAPHTFWRTED